MSAVCFISDVHSQYNRLQKAVDYAESQNLRIIFLGDLFDTKIKYSDSVGTLNLVRDCVNRGHFCINSNHQSKLIRHLRGNKVVKNNGLDRTIDDFERGGVDLEKLHNFLNSFAYGVIFRNSHGKEFRAAHAYFCDSITVKEYNKFRFIYGRSLSKNQKKMMIYGILDRDYQRRMWWENPNENQNFVRVAGHYHVVHTDNQSVVIDSGCGEGGALSLYNADTRLIKEF